MNKKTTKTKKQIIEKNPFENPLEQIGQFGMDLGEGMLDQILGQNKHARRGDLAEGQELIFRNLQEEQLEKFEENEEKPQIEAAIDYRREIIHAGEGTTKHESQEIEMQLREIIMEIKRLTDSSKELQMQFKEVAIDQYIENPGDYHKSFFSWLLSMIQATRAKIEDSGAWLSALNSKKKMKNYTSMAKKHGTSFTLNNERNVATQVG